MELSEIMNFVLGGGLATALTGLFTIRATVRKKLAEADKAKADKVMTDILNMQDDFVSRISHTEPGNVKGFYKKLREDFNKRVDEILEAMGQLKN